MFLFQKKNCKMLPVINLKPLNQLMESLESAVSLVRSGDYLAMLDLKDAYFSVPKVSFGRANGTSFAVSPSDYRRHQQFSPR